MIFFYTPSKGRRAGGRLQKEEAQVEAVEVEVDPKDIPDVSKYDELSTTYENLKWRIISRPGGATMKPLNFYRMGGRDATLPHSLVTRLEHFRIPPNLTPSLCASPTPRLPTRWRRVRWA